MNLILYIYIYIYISNVYSIKAQKGATLMHMEYTKEPLKYRKKKHITPKTRGKYFLSVNLVLLKA
jgi:hypothetical protein